MFSVIFPGQGSQSVGMGKEFYDKYDLVKLLFKDADEALDAPLSKIILEGPKEELDLTANTQPAIFLISYSIFQVIKQEFNIDLTKAKFFAGHSLGEYSALSSAGYLDFKDTIKILKIRGNAMQNSVPKGEGGMTVVLGATIEEIENLLKENQESFKVEIANDNSEGQIVLSGKIQDLDKLSVLLKEKKIKNITADEIFNAEELKDLLVKQIENRVRWRESVVNMITKGVNQFIEIGPGKVLSGLVKRINKEVLVSSINTEEEIKNIKI